MSYSDTIAAKRTSFRQANKISFARLLIYLILSLGSVVMLFPFIWLLRSSLMENNQIFIYPPQWIPNPFQWSNYSEALTSVPFYQYFKNTMFIELINVSGVMITSLLAGYSFARLKWPGRNFVFSIILATLMLPGVATLIPTFMMWKSLGALNTYWPLTVPAWFGGGSVNNGAFHIFLVRQFIMSIPKELDEAAYMDGAKPFTVLWKVILPLAKPAMIVVGIFTFIDVWNDFLAPIIYLSSSAKFTLSLGLSTFKGLYNAQWGYLMAASAAIVSPILLLFFLAQRYFVEGITMTGIKG